MGSGQSQFATLKLRSLALVPSSGALTRPCKLHLWQLHCKTLPFGLTPLQGETRGRSAPGRRRTQRKGY